MAKTKERNARDNQIWVNALFSLFCLPLPELCKGFANNAQGGLECSANSQI